jgi:hypothetical protein
MRLDNSDLVGIRDRAKAVWADIHHFTGGGASSEEAETALTDTRHIITLLDKAIGDRRTAAVGVRDDDEMTKLLAGCIGAVEANSFEAHALWQLNDAKVAGRKLTWQGGTSGLLVCVGEVGGNPIYISLLTPTIGGHKMLFYYATSTFVDHDMVRAWLDTNMPASARRSDGRINHTDATNFHNIFGYDRERQYAD